MNALDIHSLLIVAVAAVFTFLTRLAPFALFGGKKPVPLAVRYLGSVLPPAIIAILVIYCLRATRLSTLSAWLPSLLSVALVAGLHVWKRSNLLSIGAGTLFYMALAQYVFVP